MLKLLLLLLTVGLFFACSKDEEQQNEDAITADLVGQWKITSRIKNNEPINDYLFNSCVEPTELKFYENNESRCCMSFGSDENNLISCRNLDCGFSLKYSFN